MIKKSIKITAYIGLLLGLINLISGCGQSGPLYLDTPAARAKHPKDEFLLPTKKYPQSQQAAQLEAQQAQQAQQAQSGVHRLPSGKTPLNQFQTQQTQQTQTNKTEINQDGSL